MFLQTLTRRTPANQGIIDFFTVLVTICSYILLLIVCFLFLFLVWFRKRCRIIEEIDLLSSDSDGGETGARATRKNADNVVVFGNNNPAEDDDSDEEHHLPAAAVFAARAVSPTDDAGEETTAVAGNPADEKLSYLSANLAAEHPTNRAVSPTETLSAGNLPDVYAASTTPTTIGTAGVAFLLAKERRKLIAEAKKGKYI